MKILFSAILLFMSIQSSASEVFDQEIYQGPEVKFETYSTKTQSDQIDAIFKTIDLGLCRDLEEDIVRQSLTGFKVETIKYAAPINDRYPVHMIEITSVNEVGAQRTKAFNCPRSF